jgi:transketolase
MYVAEQQMIAACVGFDVAGWKPFASAFAAFFSRAYDFIRMASISRASINLCGSHAGVATGEDGPSQMALEDIAMIRAINDSTVLYPCDANQTAKLVALMPDVAGVTYLRTTRAETPVIYAPDEEFRIGGSRVLRESDDDAVTIVAAGITVHEALAAAERLLERDIRVCLIDAYSVKPIDGATIAAAARATGGRVVTVEDHWPEGGLGEATLSALGGLGLPLRLLKLAVPRLSTSGTPGELLAAAEIDADAIVNAVEALLADES